MKRIFYAPTDGAAGGKLIGEATPEQIAEWKNKYPLGIYGYKVSGRIIYLRNPDFDELNFSLSKADPNAVLDMWKAFAEATKLGGDDTILTSAPLFSGLMRVMGKKMDGIKGELVDL